MNIDEKFAQIVVEASDINEHCLFLKSIASQCDHITEFGVRYGVSTIAFLAGRPLEMRSYDKDQAPADLLELAATCSTNFKFTRVNVLTLSKIEDTDVLFIDSLHTEKQVHIELLLFSEYVSNLILLHDTVTYGDHDEGNSDGDGLMAGINSFLRGNEEWVVMEHFYNNNGLLVLERVE